MWELPSVWKILKFPSKDQAWNVSQNAPSIHKQAFSKQQHLLQGYQDKARPVCKILDRLTMVKISEWKYSQRSGEIILTRKKCTSNMKVDEKSLQIHQNCSPIACNTQDFELNTK